MLKHDGDFAHLVTAESEAWRRERPLKYTRFYGLQEGLYPATFLFLGSPQQV